MKKGVDIILVQACGWMCPTSADLQMVSGNGVGKAKLPWLMGNCSLAFSRIFHPRFHSPEVSAKTLPSCVWFYRAPCDLPKCAWPVLQRMLPLRYSHPHWHALGNPHQLVNFLKLPFHMNLIATAGEQPRSWDVLSPLPTRAVSPWTVMLLDPPLLLAWTAFEEHFNE